MESFVDLHAPSATELLKRLKTREVSSSELVEESIARIERFDDKINAVVIRDFEHAREMAQAADAAIAKGEQRPLLGLPITVKESFNVKGLPTSWGNPQFRDWQPDHDALAVERLKAAGAIIIGKTNVPFMLKDWQADNEIYGKTNNPWDLTRTPGGSSGGAAAALAAGFVSLELGSDMAGSLRVPAHYCGVYAHRPSFDLIPMRGTEPPLTPSVTGSRVNDFAVAGPMARTAADLKLALDVMAGPDKLSAGKAYQLSLPQARHRQLSDFRVLVLDHHPHCPIDNDTKQAFKQLASRLLSAGVNVVYDAPNLLDLDAITQNYATLFASFIAEKMPINEYEQMVAHAKTIPGNDKSFKACFQRGLGLTHRDWQAATRQRKILSDQWRLLFNDIDVVLQPVTPTAAFPHDRAPVHERLINIDGQSIPYTLGHVWISISSLCGLPVTAMPIDRSTSGLPIGMQVIAPYLEDYTSLAFAELYSNILP